jgi:uncharacterized protein YndB with AHSA1/START domain
MRKRTGMISVNGEEATITFERHLPFPIEKVWAAITEPEKRAVWFGPTTIDPQEGGIMITTAEGPPAPEEIRRTKAEILVWDPPHVFEYEETSGNVGETIVRFELERKGNKTFLRLINSRLRPEDAGGYAPGWHAFLDRLEAQLTGEQLPDWGIRYGKVRGNYQ